MHAPARLGTRDPADTRFYLERTRPRCLPHGDGRPTVGNALDFAPGEPSFRFGTRPDVIRRSPGLRGKQDRRSLAEDEQQPVPARSRGCLDRGPTAALVAPSILRPSPAAGGAARVTSSLMQVERGASEDVDASHSAVPNCQVHTTHREVRSDQA